MGYILIEENLFRTLMGRILNQMAEVKYQFSESDYWMNGKEVCEFLNISQKLLNAYRNNGILFFCKIKETYHYKRAEVYMLKTKMDRELVDSGIPLGSCRIVNWETEAIKVFEDENSDLQIETFEK